MNKKVIITGGGGFIGSYLVKKMVKEGWNVGVIDTMIRGDQSRFAEVADDVELHSIDVRDENLVTKAVKGADVVMHLAAINGTENFYKHPELVLDVGIRGAISIVNACKRAGVYDLVVASTAEVYQEPSIVPTPEEIPLMLPNSLNPRYSYGGSKIASELIAFNYGKEHFNKVQVFRPHNIYGPDMGWKHVIPQFILRAADVLESSEKDFAILGDGSETRAFCYIDDVIDGILKMYSSGGHREIYHIGNDEEVTIRQLVNEIAQIMRAELNIIPSEGADGATPKRCPDIRKMKKIGYDPGVNLRQGLEITIQWYLKNRLKEHSNKLM